MIEVTVEDNFTPFLNSFLSRIYVMRQTFVNIASYVENETRPLVPLREGDLESSYKWSIRESTGFFELEMGYSVFDNGFDYAIIQHEKDFDHPIRGEQFYLLKGFSQAEEGMFVALEEDFLSLFGL